MHLLELLRTDAQGRVTERVARWINRPGIEPEVVASGACDAKKAECNFVLTWAHPQKFDPKKLVLRLDGVKRWEGVTHNAQFTIAKGSKPQILVCDAEFPDGTRASYTRTLYAFYPEEAQASLLAVPVAPQGPAADPDAVAETLRQAGWPIRTVEKTEPEVTFVMDVKALDALIELSPAPAVGLRRRYPADGSRAFDRVHVVFPEESLPAVDIPVARLGSVHSDGRPPSRFSRYADAVAAAGYGLGATPHARAVVLILFGFDRPNISSFTAAQVQAYLAEVMVPLYVWRVGNVEAPEWPESRRIGNRKEFLAALDDLRADVDRQRIAWIEGSRDMRYLGRFLAPGIALAGRGGGSVPDAGTVRATSKPPGVLSALGPDGGPVHALAASADGTIFAATHAGIFRRREGSARWEPRSAGLPIAPVRSIAAVGRDGAALVAGTESGIFRTSDSGGQWAAASGAGGLRVTALAPDPGNPRLLYAGLEGSGVWRSDDSGASWFKTAMDHGDVRALAIDPRSLSVFAASEAGVFRSADRGFSWKAVTAPPARVLALSVDPAGGRLLAATAGEGVCVSTDAGATWKKTGPADAYLTSLAAIGSTHRLLAGSPDGIYVSEDGGAHWRLSRCGPVESLLAAGPGAPLAGGALGVLRREEDPAVWRPFNDGLSASVVHAVVFPVSAGEILAATDDGLLRRTGGGRWDRLSGVPQGVVAYALAALPDAALLLGTSGSIGRREGRSEDWLFRPSLDAFAFARDAASPTTVLAATRGGVLRSEDDGRTWRPSGAGLEKTFALQLGVTPAVPPAYYVATAGGGVFRSGDAGATWKAGGLELTRRVVRCVTADAGGEAYAGTDGGVFSSIDRGESWLPRDEGLPRVPVYAVAADAAPGTLFAGTAQGLFRTTDGGASWTPFPEGGLPVPVTSLFLDRDTLLVGSFGAGVFAVPRPPAPPR